MSSSNGKILFLRESNKIPAKSSVVTFELVAKSGLPTSPMNKVSPVKIALFFPFSSESK